MVLTARAHTRTHARTHATHTHTHSLSLSPIQDKSKDPSKWSKSRIMIYIDRVPKQIPYKCQAFSRCTKQTSVVNAELSEGVGWKVEIIYLSLLCRHQNDSCIKMGTDKSHFNVLLTASDKVTGQCPQTNVDEKGEPKRIPTEIPLRTSLTPYR